MPYMFHIIDIRLVQIPSPLLHFTLISLDKEIIIYAAVTLAEVLIC